MKQLLEPVRMMLRDAKTAETATERYSSYFFAGTIVVSYALVVLFIIGCLLINPIGVLVTVSVPVGIFLVGWLCSLIPDDGDH